MDRSERSQASNSYIRQFYHLLCSRGMDAEGVLRQIGINPSVVDRPGERIDTDQLARLVLAVWDLTGDEAMTLSSSPLPRGSFYLMGKLAIHEPNLRRAVLQGSRFMGMLTQAFRMQLQVSRDTATVRFILRDPGLDRDHLLAAMLLMAWHRFGSWLIAENITLTEVYFDYPVPEEVGEYGYLFPGRQIFDADFLGFSFPRRFLERETVQNAASLKIFIQRCPREFFLRPRVDFSLSGELRLLLSRHARQAYPSIDEAAQAMHMTRRTLIRRLKQEGTSYQALKDQIRRDRALQLLARQSLSVARIAEELGFSDAAVFSRAFRSWMGLSPREYRNRQGMTG